MHKLMLPTYVSDFMQAFREKGFEIFVVGGPVRNMILKQPIDNWDFASNATPEEVLDMFDRAKYENSFGTVIVPIEIGPEDSHVAEETNTSETIIMEVTPFRKEGTYSDGRHPDNIEWADSIEDDVKRRDFTINALAYDGTEMLDLVDGMNDLESERIKAVGDPERRFQEDALRMMRAVRFATQLDFHIEEKTYAAIKKHAGLLSNISWERIRDEFLKTLATDRPAEGIEMMRELGITQVILPELDAAFGVEQKSPERHHELDVGTHLVEALRHCDSPDPITRFATLLHDIGKPATREVNEDGVVTFYNHEIVGANIAHNIAERFRLSKKDRVKLTKLVRYHMFSVSEELTDKAVRRFITRIGKDNIDEMLALRVGDRVGSGVPETSWRTELFKKRLDEVQKQPFTVHDLKLSGHDLIKELGIKPGPEMGRILNELFEKVADGQLKNEREVLLEEVRNATI